MKRKKPTLRIVIKIDQAKELRRASRIKFGLPGKGRKINHPDQKKEANRKACRKNQRDE